MKSQGNPSNISRDISEKNKNVNLVVVLEENQGINKVSIADIPWAP